MLDNENGFNIKHGFLALLGVAGVFLIIFAFQLFSTNDAGYFQVKQAAVNGKMSVIKEPGMYWKMFGATHEYKISDTYNFNSKEGDAIDVRFNDAATAKVSGAIKFRLSLDDKNIQRLHQDFRSYEAVQHDLVRQVVAAALKQTATFFRAEEVYSTRRSEFINLINDQIREGIYATTYNETFAKDEDGNTFLKRNVNITYEKDGNPKIADESAFKAYGVEIIQFVVNDIDFDDKTNELIAKRKEAEQEKVVAKANAERAKQDAITATENGKAKIAVAEADALVKKKTAVIQAEQEKEIAEQNALKAVEEKKKIIALGEAEAESAKLKVAAGLTPLDKATIDKDTAILVAHELAQIKLPSMMIIGGNSNGSAMNPFDAVGLESFMRISKSMTTTPTK